MMPMEVYRSPDDFNLIAIIVIVGVYFFFHVRLLQADFL